MLPDLVPCDMIRLFRMKMSITTPCAAVPTRYRTDSNGRKTTSLSRIHPFYYNQMLPVKYKKEIFPNGKPHFMQERAIQDDKSGEEP